MRIELFSRGTRHRCPMEFSAHEKIVQLEDFRPWPTKRYEFRVWYSLSVCSSVSVSVIMFGSPETRAWSSLSASLITSPQRRAPTTRARAPAPRSVTLRYRTRLALALSLSARILVSSRRRGECSRVCEIANEGWNLGFRGGASYWATSTPQFLLQPL